MIPSEPDPDNTGEGKRLTFSYLHSAAPRSRQSIAMAEVFINQKTFEVSEHGTLADVLPLLQIAQADGIAIAVNEAVVPREEWSGYVLREGDRVFVIRATQGG